MSDIYNSGIAPSFENQQVGIAAALTDEYLPYFCVTLQSIMDHRSEAHCYDIVVFDDKIPAINKEKVYNMIHGIDNVHVRFIDISKCIAGYSFKVEEIYKPIIYARLIIPHYMRRFNRIIYVDADIMLLTDIASLYDVSFNENVLLGVKDTGMLSWYHTQNSPERVYIDRHLKLLHPESYINSGLLVYNVNEFCKAYSTEYLLSYASSQDWRWRDQDILMTLFDGKIGLLPQSWNVLISCFRNEQRMLSDSGLNHLLDEYRKALEKPNVLHFIGTSFLMLDPQAGGVDQFWKTARHTPAYEIILQRAITFTLENDSSYRKLWEKILQDFQNKATVRVLDMFEHGKIGFRFIIRCFLAWMKYKLCNLVSTLHNIWR